MYYFLCITSYVLFPMYGRLVIRASMSPIQVKDQAQFSVQRYLELV